LGIVIVIVVDFIDIAVRIDLRCRWVSIGIINESIAGIIGVVRVIFFDSLVGAVSSILASAIITDIVIVAGSNTVVILIRCVAFTVGRSIVSIVKVVVIAVFIKDLCTIPPTKHNVAAGWVPSRKFLEPLNHLPWHG
jgi:hypothetical protein